ncbi:Tat pathway signal protein [Roseicella frigidaeris]|uniref:Tat pathway signal protein n=1 Tax=Roseicella frigidaeris TaxID=2230885 RepID=A0A327MEP7_9PROT|nr:Tat pathway signal protein [Roseicella frigidaeris]RAI60732.1 Tat pathway signal protein [Roseicella frigidaeris]
MTLPSIRGLCGLAALAALLVLPGLRPAAARSDAAPALRLELNRLEARDGGACRIWMVLNNGQGEGLDPVRLDLVLFGRNGVVARRLAVDVGPLPAGRTVVRIFDLAGQACDGIGQVLLNDVLACGAEPGRNACIEQAVLASRVDGVAFQK